MLRTFILISIVSLFSVQSAFALSISYSKITDSLSADTAVSTWINDNGLVGEKNVLEDFEEVAGAWATNYVSADLGEFVAGGAAGTGLTSYNASHADTSTPYFQIVDLGTRPDYFGRVNTTAGGSTYLDSADITRLTLEMSAEVKNLYFFLSDPSDVSATTTTEAADVTVESDSFDLSSVSRSSLWFVGIVADENIGTISWTTTNTNDGYGLDDFTTVAPVPEPATLVLLGAGLVGLAIVRRRKM